MIVTDKLSTESFHAFIDEQLTDEQYVQVEAQLDEIPEKIEEIQQCQIINERLREVFDPVVEEPLPEELYELGLYGTENNMANDTGPLNYEDISTPYTDLEEDIAAIDMLDELPDEVDENYIDDSDATDLEVLAQTEHLSDFDIDALREDGSNIIPDIFDEVDTAPVNPQQAQGPAAAGAGNEQDISVDDEPPTADPADDLLESIDDLSLELEKAHSKASSHTQVDDAQTHEEAQQQATDQSIEQTDEQAPNTLADGLNVDDLELTPLNDEQQGVNEEPAVADEEDIQVSAKEKVLENLAADDLSLEPLEGVAEDGFVQDQSNDFDVENIPELGAEFAEPAPLESKPGRPRNLRGEQQPEQDFSNNGSDNSADDSAEADLDQVDLFGSQEAVSGDTAADDNSGNNFDFNPDFSGGQNHEAPSAKEDNLPDDLVAEFFSESKNETDFEVNEVVRQFGEVSDNFNSIHDDHLFDDGPAAGIKQKAAELLDTTNDKIVQIKNLLVGKKSEIFNKFQGNKDEFDFGQASFNESPEVADALDLSSFEGLTQEKTFAGNHTSPAAPQEDPSQTVPSKTVPSKARPKANTMAEPASVDEPVFDNNISLNLDDTNAESFEMQPEPKPVEFASNDQVSSAGLNMDFDLNEGSAENNLVSKFGDTLKRYKNKIAELREANANEVVAESGIDKYKKMLSGSFETLTAKGNTKIAAAGVLVIGLVAGGLIVSMTSSSENSISNRKLEDLAIETHLLNTQFNTKLAEDADSTIIEKLQWFSARIGHQVRLADIRIEDFEFKKVSVMPTMASYAAASIFENKGGQRMTVLAIPDIEGVSDLALTCRIPATVDGLCVWVSKSVRYIVVANLSLSRVRSFSQQIVEKL